MARLSSRGEFDDQEAEAAIAPTVPSTGLKPQRIMMLAILNKTTTALTAGVSSFGERIAKQSSHPLADYDPVVNFPQLGAGYSLG